MPKAITISKRFVGGDDLVVIPRKEYERLLARRKVEEFNPTVTQKKALASALNNFKRGKTLTYDEFARQLASRG